MQANASTAVVVLLALALVGVSGTAAADPIETEVAGHTVTVLAAEQDTVHNEVHTETNDIVYHAESVTTGARVDGEGAEVTATHISRDASYNGPEGWSSHVSQGVRVGVTGDVAGFQVDESVDVTYYDTAYDFGGLEHAEGDHVIVTHRGNTWGNGIQLWSYNAASVGAGQFESPWMNPDPVFGTIAFVSQGAYLSNGGYAGPVAGSANGGAWNDVYAGDWTGALVSSQFTSARCYDNQCQWEGVGVSECVLGLRAPFFLTC